MAPQVRPDGTVSVNDTCPTNPLNDDTVIVDVELVPTVTAGGKDTETSKSLYLKENTVDQGDGSPVLSTA